VFGVPSAILEDDAEMASVISCDDAGVAILEGEDMIYIRLQPGMTVSLRKSVQAVVLSWSDDEADLKRIEIVNPSDATP